MFDDGLRAKFIEFPSAVYSMHPFDRVTVDGKPVGLSTWIGYSSNEGKMLTLAMLDEQYADAGHRGHLRVGRAQRRHAASRPSSATCRSRSRPWSPRFPTRKWRARAMPTAGAIGPSRRYERRPGDRSFIERVGAPAMRAPSP